MAHVRTSKRYSLTRERAMVVHRPVLLVESRQTLAHFLQQEISQRWHCPVHMANSYDEAVALLQAHAKQYHLAICAFQLTGTKRGEILTLTQAYNVKTLVLADQEDTDINSAIQQPLVVDHIFKEQLNSLEYVVEMVGRLHRNQFIEILLVEDSQLTRSTLAHALTMQNFIVLQADTGAKALSLLEEYSNISIVISSYHMPDMNGIELTGRIRRDHSRSALAIIGICAQSQAEQGLQFIKNGANDFLSKPFPKEELVCRINQNLEMLRYSDTIHNLAHKDQLTQLANRRYFFLQGNAMLEKAQENANSVVVALFDIDGFKKINGSYGQQSGDQVLVQLAHCLQAHFNDALIARLGGEEFAMLLCDEDEQYTLGRLDAFRKDFASTTMDYDGQKFSVTVSIGANPLFTGDLDNMLRGANTALEQAKVKGRNCLQVHHSATG